MTFYVGCHIGATRIETGLVDSSGKVQGKIQFLSEANKGKKKLVDNLIASVREVWDKKVKAIGISVPGVVDSKGKIKELYSNCELKNLDLIGPLKKEFKVPIFIENSANCHTLAEMKQGKTAKGSTLFVLIENNISGGYIESNNLLRGNSFNEINIGKIHYKGISLDDYAAFPALKRISTYNGKQMSPSQLLFMSKKRNSFSRQIFQEYGNNLGNALSLVVNILDPANIVIGGPIVQSYPLFKKNMQDTMKKRLYAHTFRDLSIRVSKLEDAGIIGASLICKK